MTTQYTTILKLALPVQGELSGTWGDVVNDNITQMVEQAVAGKAVVNTWTGNSHTLTTADGTTSESRCAILELTDSGTALTGAGTVVCPTNTKLYIVDNNTAQIITVKTSAGTGVAVPVGKTMLVYCDGTNVVEGVTHANSLSLGTSTVTADKILDEDNMASDSATAIATQQSIKAYVDSQVGTVDTLSEILANGNTTGANDIAVDTAQKVQFRDTAIYINSSADGQLDIVADTEIQIAATTVDLNGNLDVSGTTVSAGKITADAGIDIDNINIDGTTIALSSGDLTLDVAGDIVLDADGGQVTLSDAGSAKYVFNMGTNQEIDVSGSLNLDVSGDFTVNADGGDILYSDASVNFGKFTNDSQNFVIQAGTPDKDIIFKGTDDSTVITALTLDMSAAGAATFNSSVTATGTSVFASLDISGDIDVDGTTNLDVVDIDGAVDMASTLQVDGSITSSDGMTITTADNLPQLQLISTDADNNIGPVLDLWRNSASPADGDDIGRIYFYGENDASQKIEYVMMRSSISDVTDGTEDSQFQIYTYVAGVQSDRLHINPNETIFNESSRNVDFRVESNGNANMLFVDGGTNRIGIGTSSPSYAVDIQAQESNNTLARLLAGTNGSASLRFQNDAAHFDLNCQTTDNFAIYDQQNGRQPFTITAGSAALVINEDSKDMDFRVESDGNANMLFVDGGANAVGIGMASPSQTLSIGGGLTVTASATLPAALGYMTFSYEAPVNRMYIGDGTGYSLAISKRASSTTTNLITLSDNGYLQTYPSAGQDAVFNEGGVDADFRVESNDLTHMLFVDAANNRIGIGQSSPDERLHIIDNSNSALMPFVIGNENITANSTSQSVAMGFGLARDSGTVKNNAGLIKVGKTAAWTAADTNVDSYMGFSVYKNNVSTEHLKIEPTQIRIGNTTDHVMVDISASNARIELVDNSQSNPPTIIGNGPNFLIENGGVERVSIDGSGNTVFNETGTDSDFRVESDTDANALFVDGGTGRTTVKELALSVGGVLTGEGAISVGTSATDITSANDMGTLVIVAGNASGAIFSDLVFFATTMGATVLAGGTVSGGPASRTYSVVSSKLKLAMASGTYSVKATAFMGTL